jgi:hypothetical protein
VAPSLNGVVDIAVIIDPMAHGETARRMVVPSLLPRLGALGPQSVRAVAGGVATAPSCLWGVSVRAVPIGSSRHLGRPRECDVAPGCRALGLILEGDAEELLCLVQPFVSLRVWHVRDVF